MPLHESTPEAKKPGFLNESEILERVPVSRRTLADWKAKGWIPYIKIGKRCLYDWDNVRAALLRMERGRQSHEAA